MYTVEKKKKEKKKKKKNIIKILEVAALTL